MCVVTHALAKHSILLVFDKSVQSVMEGLWGSTTNLLIYYVLRHLHYQFNILVGTPRWLYICLSNVNTDTKTIICRYDRQKLTLKDISNCMFVAAMNPTAGSFTIDSRLQRQFCTFAVRYLIALIQSLIRAVS